MRQSRLSERPFEKIDFWTSRCWSWLGARNDSGYGQLQTSVGQKSYAHRWMYERTYGPIPEGLWIDHLCRNTSCMRPTHLQAVTPWENTKRGKQFSLRTHCKRGHAFDEQNRSIRKNQRPWYGRPEHQTCRTCFNANQRRYRHARAGGFGPVRKEA